MKKVFAILALTAASFAFVACNKSKTTENADSTAAPQEQTLKQDQEPVTIVGDWKTKKGDVETVLTIVDDAKYNLKEGEKETKDQAYTKEGNKLTLADGTVLELSEDGSKLTILDKEGKATDAAYDKVVVEANPEAAPATEKPAEPAK